MWTAPSAGAYCTGTQLDATSSGVRCCTNKYGKQMLLRVCTRSVSGSEVCVTGGFKTRSSARSQVGEFVCGDRYFGVRKAHTAYQDIDFTLRLTASGEVACWVDHHAQKHGLPVSAPHIYSAASGIRSRDSAGRGPQFRGPIPLAQARLTPNAGGR